ncbi:MAG TPA: type II toxin-antitoxin system PemK/MazF family toxin [Blastocatellia bacterium]
MAGRKKIIPRRGDLYLVNFDPSIGAEIKKTRPALILQNDIANRHSPITIVAAISSKFDDDLYPTEVPVPAAEGGLSTDSVVLLNQIRSVDQQRLVKRLGVLSTHRMRLVDKAIRISLGLVQAQ